MKVKRTHDLIYLKENRKNKPKEYFKFIGARSSKCISHLKKPSILDIGCATGDFIGYLAALHKHAEFMGMDVIPELIDRARSMYPNCSFFYGDIYSGKKMPKIKFDVIFMSGVHSIFDDHIPWIDNLLKIVKPSGRIFVFGIFNPEPIDVLVKARRSSCEAPWESGWNLISRETIGNYLKMLKVNFKFIPWQIKIDIPKNKKDPLRSWTFRTSGPSRLIVNGTQVLHHFALLEIKP